VRRGTPDCDDCLVSFVIDRSSDELQMEPDDMRVAQMLVAEGLVGPLRYLSVVPD
jgi:hypothetical protein